MAVRDRRRKEHPEQGASAVEFALVLPILTFLVFGIISFGIIFAQQLSLGNASRQGARFGAADNTNTCAAIVSETRGVLTNTLAMNLGAVTYTITRGADPATATNACTGAPATSTTIPCTGSGATDNLYVGANYTSQMIVPFVQPSFALKGTGGFRCEFK